MERGSQAPPQKIATAPWGERHGKATRVVSIGVQFLAPCQSHYTGTCAVRARKTGKSGRERLEASLGGGEQPGAPPPRTPHRHPSKTCLSSARRAPLSVALLQDRNSRAICHYHRLA